jgi:hypothetical protein
LNLGLQVWRCRDLAIGLWHYLQAGEIPVGARLMAAHA